SRVNLVVSKGLPPVDVPSLVGKSEDAAEDLLDSANLEYRKADEKHSNQYAAGEIISQTPAAGTSVDQGTTVSVVVSLGPPLVQVPDVVDMPLEDAIDVLTEAGFKYETYDLVGISPLDRVAKQDPEGGSMAPRGSVITLAIV
ncbi:MAG TPA: PASTA domain-containing protein, partial [Actinomycetes bacterium]|nr:PASTA domain-containing protein [Actinomycetes bacterium]